jgi:hemoglobin
MKTDLANRADIEKLVNAFYEKVKIDPVIGYLFTDVAQVNWALHLPKMYDFWENAVFFSGNYDGNPMKKHKELNDKSKLNKEHFQHWNTLFSETVDSLFEGKKAEEIKQRAINISGVMRYKAIGE